MRFNLKSLSVLLAFSALVSVAKADDISLGYPGYGGNGCPQGSVSATLSPDNKSLSLIFDSFVAEAGPASGRTLDRKTCNVAIPLHVPQGFSVSIIGADYRGFVGLPRRASAQFMAEYFIAGQRGPTYVKQFAGGTNQDYFFQNMIGVQAVVWSACGADTNIRTNISMRVSNTDNQDALATVDTADFSAGILYQLSWKRC